MGFRLWKKRPRTPCNYFSGGYPIPTTHVFAHDYAERNDKTRLQPLPSPRELITRQFPLNRGPFVDMCPATVEGEAQTYKFRSNFVFTIPKGRVLGEESVVLTPENELLVDSATLWCRPVASHAVFRSHSLPTLRPTSERIAVFSANDCHYFHWNVNTIARLEMLRLSGVSYDKLYVGPLRAPFQFETLAKMGVDLHKVIVGHPVNHLECAEVIVPSFPSHSCDFTPFSIDLLRRLFLTKKVGKPNRRLYVSRNGAGVRRLINEGEIFELLRKRGFERVVLESMTIAEQAALFASAESIVTPHGAALTNLAYCAPGVKLVEIYHPLWIVDCFWQASHYVGAEHYVFLADRGYRKWTKRFKTDRTMDIFVNARKFESYLSDLGL